MPLNICEIFYSLQGESTFAGLPCVFIRLAGCNLACAWCDTPYARTESTRMAIETVLNQTDAFDCSLVEITGGEPMLQAETPVLVRELIRRKQTVLLETNGSRPIKGLPAECIKIMDVKCPSSRESGSFLFENTAHLSADDEVKFVIGTRQDYDYAKDLIAGRLSHVHPSKIHLSPVFGKVPPARLAAWILSDNLGARLSLQQHKFIWDPDKRGV